MSEIIWDEFDPEWDAKDRIANGSNVFAVNEHHKDPQGLIPVGWVNPHNYKVIAFFGGPDILHMMVGIKYKGCTGRYSTTLDYITVLKDFLEIEPYESIRIAQNQYRQDKIKKHLKNEEQNV